MSDQERNILKPDSLVDYIDKNLPPLRSGVEMIPVHHDKQEMIYFHDPQGYVVKPFVLDREIAVLIPLLNGQYSVRDICAELKRYGSDVEEEQLLAFVRRLDESRLLHSPWFHRYRKEIENRFERAKIRDPVCAGQSYLVNTHELKKMLEAAFSSNAVSSDDKFTLNGVHSQKAEIDEGRIKALYAPHIDPRIGLSVYVSAFRSLAEIQPLRVILIGTSHYAGLYHPIYEGKPFIFSRKDFKTPLGMVPADQKALDLLESDCETTGATFQDRAHRNEHSLELHLIFLQYLWSHPFQIVPMLVGSLDDLYYKEDGDIGGKVEAMANLLRDRFGDDDETLFLISGDLAHIGKKFGDSQPASVLLEKVNRFDKEFLLYAEQGNKQALLELMKREYDPFKICGFPPLYTALSALRNIKGVVFGYELWDEKERESAVTYGSLLYRKSF